MRSGCWLPLSAVWLNSTRAIVTHNVVVSTSTLLLWIVSQYSWEVCVWLTAPQPWVMISTEQPEEHVMLSLCKCFKFKGRFTQIKITKKCHIFCKSNKYFRVKAANCWCGFVFSSVELHCAALTLASQLGIQLVNSDPQVTTSSSSSAV